MQVIDHLGGNSSICVSSDGSVNIVFVFDTFDQAFPSSVQITMNNIPLLPIGPVAIQKNGFLNFVSMKLSNADYVRLAEDANQHGSAFVLRGNNDVIIQWYDYVPPFQQLPNCACFNSKDGTPVPCNVSNG